MFLLPFFYNTEKNREYNADVKILILLRSPETIIYSIGHEHIKDFEKSLNAEKERKQSSTTQASSEISINHVFYKETPKYTDRDKKLFDLFERMNVYVIFFMILK